MAQLHAYDVLKSPPKAWSPVVVLYGADGWLQTQVLKTILGDDPDLDRADLHGEAIEWRDLHDELMSGSLFSVGEVRTIVLHEADDFLDDSDGDSDDKPAAKKGGKKKTKSDREQLEAYFQKPNLSNRLIVRFQKLASNTRLFKFAANDQQAIRCAAPTAGKGDRPDVEAVSEFIGKYLAPLHQCKLSSDAIHALIDLIGVDSGFLYNSIAKLSLFVPLGGTVSGETVREVIGGMKAKTTWDVISAAAEGKAAEALVHLNKYFDEGQLPLALLPQFAWSLRRFAMATAILEHSERTGQRMTVASALNQAGFKWDAQRYEEQLRKVGRQRARALADWLLEADSKLKLSHSGEERGRWVLEELFLKLANVSVA